MENYSSALRNKFNVNAFYSAAHNGDNIDLDSFNNYINSFTNIIIWGAGNLGKKISHKLLKMGIKITSFWDIRANEIGSIWDIKCVLPFELDYKTENTLIIFCITNVFVAPTLKAKLFASKYKHILIGEDLYQGLICPFDKNTPLKISVCRDLPECNVCTCKKLDNLIDYHNSQRSFNENYERLHFPNVTFVINQKCTLKCKYCYSYMNNYQKNQRINFKLERIIKDIDIFFDSVDSVTLVPVIGGEPFLHPNIKEIVARISEKKNFGILNVTTNGIVKITSKMLESFHDERCRVFFSNYTESLNSEQIDLFYKNIDFVKSEGVTALVYNTTPQWTIPVTLNNKNYSYEERVKMKKVCGTGLKTTDGKYVKNGFFYPCTIIDSVHNLKIADYSDDRIRFDDFTDRHTLRESIRAKMNYPCYETCKHCGVRGNLVDKAGEQGYQNFTGRSSLNVQEESLLRKSPLG